MVSYTVKLWLVKGHRETVSYGFLKNSTKQYLAVLEMVNLLSSIKLNDVAGIGLFEELHRKALTLRTKFALS